MNLEYRRRYQTGPGIVAVGAVIGLLSMALPNLAVSLVVGPPMQVSNAFVRECEPDIAVFGNTVIAAWHYGSERAGSALSSDGGNTWAIIPDYFFLTPPSTIEPWGQPSICVTGGGEFFVAQQVADYTRGHSIGVYRRTPAMGTAQWEYVSTALPWRLGNHGDPLDAPHIACDPASGALYLAYTLGLRTPQHDKASHAIEFVRSLDLGVTWSTPQQISPGLDCNGAQVLVGLNGQVSVFWEDFAARAIVGRTSMDGGATFGPEFSIGPIADNIMGGWQWHFSWYLRSNPVYPSVQLLTTPAFPSLAIDRSHGPRRGRIYATWPERAVGEVSPEGELVSESEPNDAPENATPIQIGQQMVGYLTGNHGGVYDYGDYFAFDGEAGTTILVEGDIAAYPTPPTPGGSGLWIFGPGADGNPVEIDRTWFVEQARDSVPPYVFTLPATGRYLLFVLGSGYYEELYLLKLRRLEPSPNSAARDHRDVVLTWSDDDGQTWSPRVRVNDDPPRFGNSLPRVVVDDHGRVHVAWYDRRDDPQSALQVHTYWTYSDDGGASFHPSRRLSTAASEWRQVESQPNIGDQLGLTATAEGVVVAWSQVTGPNESDIYAVRITDLPTSIAVPRFWAELEPSGITLRWTVRDDRDIASFYLERRELDADRFTPLAGSATSAHGPGDYDVRDLGAMGGVRYEYRLAVEHRGGTITYEGPIVVEPSGVPLRLAWGSAHPNPFSQELRLELALPRAGTLQVKVHDVRGAQVASLHDGTASAGRQMLRWDGRSAQGSRLPPGLYLVRAQLGSEVVQRRVTLIQ